MPDRRTLLSNRGPLRSVACALVLVLAMTGLVACGQDSSQATTAAAAAAAEPGQAAADGQAGNPLSPSLSPATPADSGATPAAAPIATPDDPPPARLTGIALADATAAAEPVRDGVGRRPADKPAAAISTGKVDDRCTTSADCAVKDVGSCCGYRPQCLNRDSPTFPDAVKANCASEGRVGICGMLAIESCECVQGRCVGLPPMLEDRAR